VNRIYEDLEGVQQSAAKGAHVGAFPRQVRGAFVQWHNPDEQTTVRFHTLTVQLLERDVILAKTKVVAGILFGKKDEGQHSNLIVEYYEPIVAVAEGSTISPLRDPVRLKAVINRWKSKNDHCMEIVGLYRSCPRDEADLNQDDLAALKAIATRAHSVFLLIENREARQHDAHLFLTRAGAVISKWNSRPFNRTGLEGREIVRQSDTRGLSFRGPDPQISVTQEVDVSRSPGRSQKWQWLLGSLAVVALLIAGFFVARTRNVQDSFPTDTGLGLNLAREGTDWRLSWNPKAPILRDATKGYLLITDGALRKTLDLDISDLRGGAIIYSAATNDLMFRLQIDTDDSLNPVSESVRVAAGLLSPLAFDPTVRSSGTDRFESEFVDRSAVSAVHLTEAVKNITATRPRDAVSEAAVNPLQTDITSLPTKMKQMEASSPVPLISQPEVSVDATPETSLSSEPVVKPAGVSEIPRGGRLESAQLIQHRDPVYPQSANGSEGSVELQFSISKEGSVRDVKVIKGNAILAQAALQAVQSWRYNPAQLDGNPIETEGSAVITFKNNRAR
jgi:TonB family protein